MLRSGTTLGDRPLECGQRPLFPLRLRGWQGGEKFQQRRYLARRRRDWEHVEGYVARGVRALNALAADRGTGTLLVEEPKLATEADPLSPAQHAALGNIARGVKACLPAPDPAITYPDGALCDLLQSQDVYDATESLSMAPTTPRSSRCCGALPDLWTRRPSWETRPGDIWKWLTPADSGVAFSAPPAHRAPGVAKHASGVASVARVSRGRPRGLRVSSAWAPGRPDLKKALPGPPGACQKALPPSGAGRQKDERGGGVQVQERQVCPPAGRPASWLR